LEILTRASSFDDLMRRVIGAGGDTDTVGSMAGAIWEALDGIPLTWVDLVTPLLPMAVMDTVTAYHERMHA
jgi:ADP-ribosylglycohydrolase